MIWTVGLIYIVVGLILSEMAYRGGFVPINIWSGLLSILLWPIPAVLTLTLSLLALWRRFRG